MACFRVISVICILAFLCSCQRDESTPSTTLSTSEQKDSFHDTTKNFELGDSKRQHHIRLDTVQDIDSTSGLITEMVLPIFTGQNVEMINVVFRKRIDSFRGQFVTSAMKYVEPDRKHNRLMPAMFSVHPKSIYHSRNIVSYLMLIYRYYPDAPHGIADYYSFNYDLNKHMQIGFRDCFVLRDQSDSSELVALINKALGEEQVFEIYDFDFSVERTVISFNFDDYEIGSYAEGVKRAIIPKARLRKFIETEYRRQ